MENNGGQMAQQLLNKLLSSGQKKVQEDEMRREQRMNSVKSEFGKEVGREAFQEGKKFVKDFYEDYKNGKNNKEGFVDKDDSKDKAQNKNAKETKTNSQEKVTEKSNRASGFSERLEKAEIEEIKAAMDKMSPKQQESFLKHLSQNSKLKDDPEKYAEKLGLNDKQKDIVFKSVSERQQEPKSKNDTKNMNKSKGINVDKEKNFIQNQKNKDILKQIHRKAAFKTKIEPFKNLLKNNSTLAKTVLKANVPVVGKALLVRDILKKEKALKDLTAKMAGKEKTDPSSKSKETFAQAKGSDAQSKSAAQTMDVMNKAAGAPVKDVKDLISKNTKVAEKSAEFNLGKSAFNQVKDIGMQANSKGEGR